MSLTLNMVGGGGGGSKPSPTDAVLRVTAPSGSTVTITKSGVTRMPNFYLDGTDTDTFFFYIKASNFGSYTVTATLDDQEATGTINIELTQEYSIELTHLVPSEYQTVEYLESTGAQFIETNISNCQNGFRVVTDFLYTAHTTWGMMFGRQGLYGVPSQTIYFYNTSSVLTAKAGTGDVQSLPLSTVANQWYAIDFSCITTDAYIVINGNRKTLTGGNTSLTQRIRIFCGTSDNGSDVSMYAVKARFKRLYLYNTSNELIGDFVPCYRKSDNVAGMWDRVTKTFYTNAGTGTFIVGEPI